MNPRTDLTGLTWEEAIAAPELRVIDVPATCLRCGVTITNPTTGKILNRCGCGGEIKTNHEHVSTTRR